MGVSLIYVLPMIYSCGTAIAVRKFFVKEDGSKSVSRLQAMIVIMLSLIPFANILLSIIIIILTLSNDGDYKLKTENKFIKWLIN